VLSTVVVAMSVAVVLGVTSSASAAKGKPPKPTTTLFNAPSQLYTPTVGTAQNVKSVIFDKGIYKASQVCTGVYQSSCSKLGIQ